jgi:uncharacterized protein
MARDEIIARIKDKEDVIREAGVAHLAIFGSRARGDARPESDLDVLVDIDPSLPKFSLIDLAGVCRLLTEVTGIETFATERKEITEAFAQRIADDLVQVF